MNNKKKCAGNFQTSAILLIHSRRRVMADETATILSKTWPGKYILLKQAIHDLDCSYCWYVDIALFLRLKNLMFYAY